MTNNEWMSTPHLMYTLSRKKKSVKYRRSSLYFDIEIIYTFNKEVSMTESRRRRRKITLVKFNLDEPHTVGPDPTHKTEPPTSP